MRRRSTIPSLRETLIREFAGSRARVAMNMLVTGATGVLFGHYGLGVPMSHQLVLGAMFAPLGAMLVASSLKHLSP